MTNLSSQNRALVFAEVQKQPYATNLANEEIDQAVASAVEIFSGFEQKFAPGFCKVLFAVRQRSETYRLCKGN